MDGLLDIAPDLEREVFWQVATLLDYEVDLLFFDTTFTYFQTDEDKMKNGTSVRWRRRPAGGARARGWEIRRFGILARHGACRIVCG
jgi:hypothetical protein